MKRDIAYCAVGALGFAALIGSSFFERLDAFAVGVLIYLALARLQKAIA